MFRQCWAMYWQCSAMFVTHAKMTYGMRSVDDNAEKFVAACGVERTKLELFLIVKK